MWPRMATFLEQRSCAFDIEARGPKNGEHFAGAGVACQAREPPEQVGRRICRRAQLWWNGHWSNAVSMVKISLAKGRMLC